MAAPVIPEATHCPACMTPLEHGGRFCAQCGNDLSRYDAVPVGEDIRLTGFECKNCGARVQCDAEARTTACAFCGSPYVVEFPPDESRQAPEFVIPFVVERPKAEEVFRGWVRSGIFRPSRVRRLARVREVRGVYLPFWSFSTRAETSWSARIGEYWWKTETYTTTEGGKTVTKTRRVRKTEWYPLSGRHHDFYSHYLVSASHGLSQKWADKLKPFETAGLQRFRPYFLAGWSSEEYAVEKEQALDTSLAVFHEREQKACGEFMPGDTYSNLEVSTDFSDITSDLILLPIWVVAYDYGKKLYRFLMNGQTGKVTGTRPISTIKVAIAVVLGIALVALIVWLGAR